MSVSWFLSCFFISWNDALFSLLHFVTLQVWERGVNLNSTFKFCIKTAYCMFLHYLYLIIYFFKRSETWKYDKYGPRPKEQIHSVDTSDQAPVLHWAGHGTLLQGLRLSGFSPLQYLLWMERFVPSCRNCTQRTVRIWKPRLLQVLVQCSHSSEIHLQGKQHRITDVTW